MVVVSGCVEALGAVADVAQRVALGVQVQPVRVVAVAAAHAGGVHAALAERAPDVDLVLDLTVGEVQIGLEEGRHVRVRERRVGRVALGDLAPAPPAAAP
jgi:hypothetical protein